MNKNDQLERVKQNILNNLKCELKDQAKNLVFGKGNSNAKILFIGEAPGAKEDEQGIPFIGKAGKDLDKQLNKISLTIDDVYIANILKYRPPQNRDPSANEMISHTPYLVEQIKIIKPKIICTLGNFATKFIMSNANIQIMKKMPGVSEVHGQVQKIEFQGEKIKLFPIFHPSATIYRKIIKEEFQKDFIKLANELNLKIKQEEIQKKLI